jgi:hypothetical protein
VKQATIPLPANATYAVRVAHWSLASLMPPAVGVLTISEGHRPGKVKALSRYAVLELTRSGMGRRFKLTKPKRLRRGRTPPESYYALVSSRR